ncbi:TPA: hypothetical protein DCZ46_02875 [Candidatus Campbellbacteria bacterium]|uniref:Uncharacterized protein n=1 Tax=Candidatus Campbellbacteria bacterium RIFCSPLOWO2_01_FULL_34_15 TaxID=1797579 RepID=A0A1F5EPF0_9BACT|nr:MAG: protein of unknown function with transmembrane region [Candidatus Campbellbacteria bacterium GW2011_OD1_34_28]KKP74930.1 MAG: hypothetical protein UR74_C0002G0196 [Candidatus Campbellbacteria bacterium GW2011_GWD2_35_24]KKP75816.1 MAG: hypothetical protein UR75_C0002G0197 [Candidatus Campbellbacteria bacterium GW2011_GWC2_35_28]KKP76936.1 MAG: hypothetical protein UR76_C0002G0137 [Candidatus Campbellbacteria bacterium GW2011_GWC1_35_31]KKP78862.1 MAG: hypothetical protein UR79_C0002G013
MKKYILLISVFLIIPFSFVGAIGTGVDNPLNVGTIQGLIDLIIKVMIQIGTPIAVLFLIFAGFLYVEARGNPGKVAKAHQALLWTLVGIAVLLGSSILAKVIAGTINQLGVGVL